MKHYRPSLIRMSNRDYNPFSRKYYHQYLQKKPNDTNDPESYRARTTNFLKRYPLSRPHYENQLKKLNSKNETIQNNSILGLDENEHEEDDDDDYEQEEPTRMKLVLHNKSPIGFLQSLGIKIENNDQYNNYDDDSNDIDGEFEEDETTGRRTYVERQNSKSKNFEVIKNFNLDFTDVKD